MPRGHTYSGTLIKAPSPSPVSMRKSIPGTPKGYVADKKGSLNPACFFAKRNYKLFATVRSDGAVSIPLNTVLDTGAGPSPSRKRRNFLTKHFYIRRVLSPRLLDAVKRVRKSCGLMQLNIRIGEFQARPPFLVVQILAVDCLLGTSFINQHVEAILAELRKVMSYQSFSVARAAERSLTKPKTSITFELEERS